MEAHPLINHAELRFGNDSREGGVLGLIGAIDFVLHKAKRTGGVIEVRHWGWNNKAWNCPGRENKAPSPFWANRNRTNLDIRSSSQGFRVLAVSIPSSPGGRQENAVSGAEQKERASTLAIRTGVESCGPHNQREVWRQRDMMWLFNSGVLIGDHVDSLHGTTHRPTELMGTDFRTGKSAGTGESAMED